MAKINAKILDVDLDVVVDGDDHALMRYGTEQSFSGVKTFNAPPRSEMNRPEAENTAVTKVMLKNITRCMNTWFEESLTVSETDIQNGYILLGKEIPEGRESSLEIVNFDGAPKMVNGVDFGVATDRLILTGYRLGELVYDKDKIEVKYAICDDQLAVTDLDVQKIIYAPELGDAGRFVAFTSSSISWSEDGVEWTKGVVNDGEGLKKPVEYNYFESADYSPTLKRFVASTDNGFMVSDDGKEWTQIDGEAGAVFWAGSLGAFYCFNWFGDIEPNSGGYGVCFVTSKSSNGRNWSQISQEWSTDEQSRDTMQVVWDETRKRFFRTISGNSGTDTAYEGIWDLYYSEDGIGWTGGAREYFVDEYGETLEFAPCFVAVSPMCIYTENESPYLGRTESRTFTSVSKDNGETWIGYSGGVFDCSWIDGLNVFLGKYGYDFMSTSSDGVMWYMTNDFKMPNVLCYAPDRDAMLFVYGNEIRVITEFSERLRNLWMQRIPLTRLKKEGGADDDPSGGGGESGGGGNDEPIDTAEWERGKNIPGLFPGGN